ncbi:MAG: hypothetical protein K0M78_03580 [Brevundimonas sp.]|nr:hypothetical protein [Brevundimonas sp.]
MLKSLIAALVLALSAAPAAAEVVVRTADSFILRYEMAAEIDPADIPGALENVGRWWDGAHTFSGDAANITIDLSPGGCWCERLADGTAFDHGRTVSMSEEQIVFDAPFGPLRGKAAKAVLTMTWPSPHGVRSQTWEMVVEGPGLGAMADAVDGGVGDGFQRWVRNLEPGEAPTTPSGP